VEIPWEDQITALLENRTDIIMSGMSITPAREYKIAFAKPYFKSGLMIITTDLQKYTFITNPETVLAQSITWRMGVVRGTTGEAFIRQHATGAKSIKAFKNQEDGLQALLDRGIDVFIHDAPNVLLMVAKNQVAGVKPLPVMLNQEYLAWGVRRGDAELLAAVNGFIERSKNDGTLRTIVKRWIPLAD
jgi:polar amino acid transport system substrate-binding protein